MITEKVITISSSGAGSVIAAEQERLLAEAAKVASQTAQTGSEAARDASVASATAAATSETNAAASAIAAANSQAASATSESNAAASAVDAANSAAVSTAQATLSTTARIASEAAQTASELAESNAAASELAAATSETNAASSASASANSATASAASATAAATSESNAAASELAAATSETNAASSASASANSATAAAASATAAATSETNAASSATAAATSASAALSSELAAATSETNAASSASAAATSATAALSSELAAATSETNAAASEANAAASENAAAAAAAAAVAVSYQDLTAIAAAKAVTAVDVFVYDTSKDSDGGAWRKRTQHTSWYNEPLNTATRGSRREFPAVAVIVATTSGLTIYDGDDPALPMWMVFNNGRLLDNVNGGISMLNGELAVGTSATYGSLRRVSFVSDTARSHRAIGSSNGTQGLYNGTISTRNDTSVLYNDDSSFAARIVQETVNDVAMTVLPDAPIDPATGLPVPTIAVATAGGVSVITDSGAVYDLTYTMGSVASTLVEFDGMGGIFWGGYAAFAGASIYLYWNKTLPTADDATAPDAVYASNGNVLADLITKKANFGYNSLSISDIIAAGASNGLFFIDQKDDAPSNGMTLHATSTYNTGWMNGDIKGAFLADTDDTDLVGGVNLVSNGTFDDTSYWGLDASWTISGGVATVTGNDQLYSPDGVIVAGGFYTLTFDVTAVNTAGNLIVIFGSVSKTVSVSTTGTFTVTAYASSGGRLRFGSGSGSSFRGSIDNVVLEEADADRSVNNKGLIINGTVNRSPVATGAELVAYSGFSASNYLEQPYNSDLDFGTGDFCVMGWISMGSTGAGRPVFSKGPLGSNPSPYFEFQTNGDNSLNWVGDNGTSIVTTTILPTGIYSHVAFVRASGTGYLYVNGELVDSAANTENYNHSNADILRFGLRHDNFSIAFNGSLALWRISATAPTAEQIKKIYEDEKVLFQENAACTLYGAFDAVTALAHDEDTGLLHVGTSAGRSVFQGLRRVSNTTTAVGTAISASNGLVVEE